MSGQSKRPSKQWYGPYKGKKGWFMKQSIIDMQDGKCIINECEKSIMQLCDYNSFTKLFNLQVWDLMSSHEYMTNKNKNFIHIIGWKMTGELYKKTEKKEK